MNFTFHGAIGSGNDSATDGNGMNEKYEIVSNESKDGNGLDMGITSNRSFAIKQE